MNNPIQPPARDGGAAIDIHEPFTPAERIQQLSEIDNDIASLLRHLSSAMRALATPPGGTRTPQQRHPTGSSNDDDDVPILESESDPLTRFRAAQTAFFHTVDRIDKNLTRQILALEEAGIITLRDGGGGASSGTAGDAGAGDLHHGEAAAAAAVGVGSGAAGGGGSSSAAARTGRVPTARVEPDGVGRYGTLDVGRLNVASSTIERDMEGELWRRAREHLAKVMGEGGGGGDRMEE
ncbi:hypothetical protein VTK56DRAFT_186 [Thermocarpiscus australiensis]